MGLHSRVVAIISDRFDVSDQALSKHDGSGFAKSGFAAALVAGAALALESAE